MEITLDHFLSSKQLCPKMQLQVTLSLPEGELEGTLYEGPLEKLPALKSGGVYAIYEKASGKFYYGSTSNLNVRLLNHLITMRNGEHKNHYFRKFDLNECDFTVKTFTVPDREQAFDIEQLLVSKCWGNPRLMNLCRDVRSAEGFKHAPETILRFKEIASNRGPVDKAVKDKISATLKGRTLDPTHVANLSEKNKAKWADPAFRDRWMASKARKIIADGVEHVSLTAAALAHSVGVSTALRRVQSEDPKYAGWQYVN